MAIKYELDSLDGVDESLASHYQQREDGKFALAFDGDDPLEGAKKAKNHEKELRAKAEMSLKEVSGNYAKVLDELKAAKFELEKSGGPKSQIDAYERKIAELNDEKLQISSQFEEFKGQSQKQHLDYVASQKLTEVLSTIAADTESLSDLKALYSKAIKVTMTEDGQYKFTFVIDGKETVASDKEFQAHVSERKPRLTLGSRGSGAGAHQSPAGGAGGKTLTEQHMAYAAQHRK